MDDIVKKMLKQLRMIEVQNKNIIDSDLKYSHLELSEQELQKDLRLSEDSSDLIFEKIVLHLNTSGHNAEKIVELINSSMTSKHTSLPYCDVNEINDVLKRPTH